jgi:serine protease Do
MTLNRFKPAPAIAGLLAVGLLLAASRSMAATPKEIYLKAGPAVVFILASEGSAMGSVGTGSIIREDGLVITNAHIFTKPDSSRLKSDIAVFLKPSRITGNTKKDLSQRYRGKILSYDIPLDLALLQIEGLDRPLATIQFADAGQVVVGEQVYAIGHPEQGGLWSLTTGVISAYRADYGGVAGKNLFQTDASINRGNSGGPLLDEDGHMVGINSLIARKAADGLTITDVNYSIMSDVALNWLAALGYRFPVYTLAEAESPPPAPPSKPVEAPPPVTQTPAPPPEKEPMDTRPPQAAPPPAPPADEPKPEPAPAPPAQPPKPTVEAPPPAPPVQPPPTAPKPPEGGKILTKKKPYKVNALIKEMQAMEDLMDEMRGKINKYKKSSN